MYKWRLGVEIPVTMEEIMAEYTVEYDIIQTPGKFQGEAVWVPYFWYLSHTDTNALDDVLFWPSKAQYTNVFILTADDKRMFPQLANDYALHMGESESGFVWCQVLSAEQVVRLCERNAKDTLDGTEGQDRDNYTDDQDRDCYDVDPCLEEN